MNNSDIFDLAQDIVRIGNYAVKKTQQESFRKGIPTVYSLNDTIFYQLPNGVITMEEPKEYQDAGKNMKHESNQ